EVAPPSWTAASTRLGTSQVPPRLPQGPRVPAALKWEPPRPPASLIGWPGAAGVRRPAARAVALAPPRWQKQFLIGARRHRPGGAYLNWLASLSWASLQNS